MDEEKIKEAKIITLAIAKIREFCQGINECKDCPLCMRAEDSTCFFINELPNEWDADQALYRIGFYAGRKEA